MKRKEAEKAIRAILAAVENSELPKSRRDNDRPDLHWFGDTGYSVGTSMGGGIRDPDVHRSMGIYGLFEREKMARLDAKHLKKTEALP